MSSKDCRVVPKGDRKADYKCGHVSWAEFSHELFGREIDLLPEVIASREKCGECLLDQVTEGITKCVRCGEPIFKGSSCIMYGDDLCCLSVSCGPGPIYAMPGVWDGEKFVDGILAGTVKVL